MSIEHLHGHCNFRFVEQKCADNYEHIEYAVYVGSWQLGKLVANLNNPQCVFHGNGENGETEQHYECLSAFMKSLRRELEGYER